MYPHQAERLEAALARVGGDALVATSAANVAYLTGFHSVTRELYPATPVFAVYGRGGAGLVVPAADAPAVAASDLAVTEVACYGRLHADLAPGADDSARRGAHLLAAAADSPADALAAVLGRLGATGLVGLDDDGLPTTAARAIADRLAKHTLRPASAALASARAVKGPYEIECLQQALRIAEESIHELLGELGPGATAHEATRSYERALGRRGARPWRAIIAFGREAALPTAPVSERPLRPGELVRLDVGCVFKGYYADVARTAVLGEPTARQQAQYDAADAGIDAAVAALAPGARGAAVVDAALDAVRSRGGREPGTVALGHGIGLEPSELPRLGGDGSSRNETLEAGMVVRLEIAQYELGAAAIHVKETVLLTAGGAVPMNRSNRGLVVLD
jgi:Xaa-Pro aminopeptidase